MPFSGRTSLAVFVVALSGVVAVDESCMGSSCDTQDSQVLLQAKMAVDNAAGLNDYEATELNESELAELSEEERNHAVTKYQKLRKDMQACTDNPLLAGVYASTISRDGYAANAHGISSWCTKVMGNPADCSGKLPQWVDGCQKTCGRCAQTCTDDPLIAGVYASEISRKGYAANADGVSSWCTGVMGNPADCSGKLPQWVEGCQKTCGRCGQAGGFTVESGSCVTTDNGKCVTSNAQGKYGNNERCTITTPSAGTVGFTKYDTERGWDYVTIDGIKYKTSTPPTMTLTAAKTVSWYSDYSVTKSGFKMCLSTTLTTSQELPVFGR